MMFASSVIFAVVCVEAVDERALHNQLPKGNLLEYLGKHQQQILSIIL